MAIALEAESTLTERYQTTVPSPIRRALNLGKNDKIHYAVRDNGEVVLTRAEASADPDPLLNQFLGFLAQDLSAHPERLKMIDANFVDRLKLLVHDVSVDLDAPLSADDE